MRLDILLTETGLAPSRSRARDMIMRGCVSVDKSVVKKPGLVVARNASIAVNDPASPYVSRAALKLVAALEASGIEIAGKVAIDLGASTGGFTQVLMERGAARVFAIEVGHGQMADVVRDDPRVVLHEGLNARDLTGDHLHGALPSVIVSDMSFVSLTKASGPALDLAASGAACALLVKPQFEVGPEGVGKGGIVTDNALIETTNAALRDWLNARPGWHVTHFLPSPVTGGDGNREFLMCGAKE